MFCMIATRNTAQPFSRRWRMNESHTASGEKSESENICGTLGSLRQAEVLLVLFGEGPLSQTLVEFSAHYHGERNHQGKDNLLRLASNSKRRSRC
jgi:hypothetical protein